MGTIKCGFWVVKFLISPEEFSEFLRRGLGKELLFGVPGAVASLEETMAKYEESYRTIVASKKPQHRPLFSLNLTFPGQTEFPFMGFVLNPEGLMFWHKNINYNAGSPFFYMSYQKGYAVEDPAGEYFTYEDINAHYPHGYPIFEEISGYIKKITKPFRMMVQGDDVKTSLRISEQAVKDLEQSWFFTENAIAIKSYKPRER